MNEIKPKILILDDSRIILNTLDMFLRDDDLFEVHRATTFSDLKSLIKKHTFLVSIIDLVIPDVKHTEHLDFTIEHNVPIIAITGTLTDSFLQYVSHNPIVDYVIKGKLEDLRDAVSFANNFINYKDKRALLVDDSTSVRRMMKSHLVNLGFFVDEAKDPKIALELIEKNEQYDLLCIDNEMPYKNGPDFIREIRHKDKVPLHIFGMHGGGDSHSIRFLKNGAFDVFLKPMKKEVFNIKLANAFNMAKKQNQLANTIVELKHAQAQLIETEKLSALGQLIAGISHEINSPLGAINASSSNISLSLDYVLNNSHKIYSLLSTEDLEIVIRLKKEVLENKVVTSLKEQRAVKKVLKLKLDQIQCKNSRRYADIFSQLNIRDIEPYVQIVVHEKSNLILEMLYHEYVTRSNLNNIDIAVNRASKTVFALKKFVHFDHEKSLALEKLEDSVENVLTIFSHNIKQGIEVKKDYKDLEDIFCYSDELSQVWMNIISNSIHAMDGIGEISINIDENQNYQIVSIQDSGCGIPRDLQDKIFDPFFTTKKSGEGSGLGLDIVKKIIDSHDGKIEFDSSTAGTKFTIYIAKEIYSKG